MSIKSITHKCNKCATIFTFRNKLFDHLRDVCWTNSTKYHDSNSINNAVVTTFSFTADIIVESNAKAVDDNDYAFRDSQYARFKLSFIKNLVNIEECFDVDCLMTIENRRVLKNNNSDLIIKRLSSSISIRDIENIIHHINQYAMIDFYMNDKVNHINHIAKFSTEIHLVDDLKTNLLINTNVMKTQKTKLDLKKSILTIEFCKNLVTSIDTIARLVSNTKRIIRARHATIISTHFILRVFVTYHDQLFDDRDYLFESQCVVDFDDDDDVFAHIVNITLSYILIRNTSDRSMKISRRSRLEIVINYNQEKCYNVTSDAKFLATSDWMSHRDQRFWKEKLMKDMTIVVATYVVFMIFTALSSTIDNIDVVDVNTKAILSIKIHSQIDLNLEHVLSNDIIVYDSETVASRIASIIDEFSQI